MKKKNIEKLKKSKYILEQIRVCIDENMENFDQTTGKTKGGKPGTHLQNFLRGTLLLSCAGLDAFLKQLIKDTLVIVKIKNLKTQEYFKKIIKKQILDKQEYEDDKKIKTKIFKDSASFIAESLLSDNPKSFVEEYVVNNLLSDSKQSLGSLLEISQAFGVDILILKNKEKEVKELFKIRNEISHEFDVIFKNIQGKRNRIERSRDSIQKNTELVYEIADSFFEAVKLELLK